MNWRKHDVMFKQQLMALARMCAAGHPLHALAVSQPAAWLQAVDAETQKAMMSYYYKKQEEQKVRPAPSALPFSPLPSLTTPAAHLQKLQEDEDDNYTNSAWANPNALKAHFSGMSQIKMPR
jgi:hypothetical protein